MNNAGRVRVEKQLFSMTPTGDLKPCSVKPSTVGDGLLENKNAAGANSALGQVVVTVCDGGAAGTVMPVLTKAVSFIAYVSLLPASHIGSIALCATNCIVPNVVTDVVCYNI